MKSLRMPSTASKQEDNNDAGTYNPHLRKCCKPTNQPTSMLSGDDLASLEVTRAMLVVM